MRLNKFAIAVFVFLFAGFVGLGVRCWYVQVKNHDYYTRQAQQTQRAVVTLPAQRGVIADAQGHCVARSKLEYDIFLDTESLLNPTPEKLFRDPKIHYKDAALALSYIFDVPAHEICMLITEASSWEEGRRHVLFKRGITTEQVNQFREMQSSPGSIRIPGRGELELPPRTLYGVAMESRWKREYPASRLFCHTVGFLAYEKKNSYGLEKWYYDTLEGVDGSETFIVDTTRKPLFTVEQQPPEMGSNLILTVDMTIQKFARDALIRRVKEYKAESGVAVVMEPATGAVRGIVSYPDYDPLDITNANNTDMKNRAITDPYEPGSIFKPIFTAVSMDNGVVTPNTVIYCENGSYSGKGFGRIGEYNNKRYGNMTPKSILVNSSNIGMAKMGQMMERKCGRQKMYESLKLFGFGQITGIDLPDESAGRLWPAEGIKTADGKVVGKWTGYSVTRIPFGQEISVTAIQIARAYCILANGGRPVLPHVVHATFDINQGVVDEFNHFDNPAQIISEKTANWIVRDALRSVVTDGSGNRADLEGYEVFGKTGTANIAVGGGFDERSYVASFVGGAPASKPELIVLVSIRRPDRSLGKGYSGGVVASPVVAEILKKSLDYQRNLDKRIIDSSAQ
ncbi:Sporulation-specific penicillin-binding protein [Limihaloglobus sulfuriphilus]|uniref:Sporulation-specific penicillin-binding protein n=1 Tax=Limihaloglobus sulfuriphilus TaxID=1851148 RepID=A0A1Q2MFS0_9BACT|nr:penicillin-binding protein 2 [Limihaloglobus sulfuriphilus]AQQ71543.1 Sporulation-specific penicillin-binding protein [Limihaloglobus sulfuriphilus]